MVNPYNDTEEKVDQVRRMFNKIAPNYDRLNRMISLGLDKSWRKQAIKLLWSYQPVTVLDLATGTGDLAIELKQAIPSIQKLVGADISEEMMKIGREKVETLGLSKHITFEVQDSTATSFDVNSFDAITIAFGIRNFSDIPKAAKELHRILRPGCPFLILELSEPKNPVSLFGYKVYSKLVIPFLGRVFAGDSEAYTYLPKSISAVPQREAMVKIFEDSGFEEVFYRSLKPGTCTIYSGIKK